MQSIQCLAPVTTMSRTPAEFAFTVAIWDGMAAHVTALAKMEKDLLAGAKKVIEPSHATA